jgi:hypothetical protein
MSMAKKNLKPSKPANGVLYFVNPVHPVKHLDTEALYTSMTDHDELAFDIPFDVDDTDQLRAVVDALKSMDMVWMSLATGTYPVRTCALVHAGLPVAPSLQPYLVSKRVRT